MNKSISKILIYWRIKWKIKQLVLIINFINQLLNSKWDIIKMKNDHSSIQKLRYHNFTNFNQKNFFVIKTNKKKQLY